MVQDHGEREEGALPKHSSQVDGGRDGIAFFHNFHLKDPTIKDKSGTLTP